MRASRWYLQTPGSFYAANFDFSTPVTEREARRDMRDSLKVDRLPRGSSVWASGRHTSYDRRGYRLYP